MERTDIQLTPDIVQALKEIGVHFETDVRRKQIKTAITGFLPVVKLKNELLEENNRLKKELGQIKEDLKTHFSAEDKLRGSL